VIAWLLACGGDLASPDPDARAGALDALSPAQARALVPQLEKWASCSDDGRHRWSDAALRALVRADSDRSRAALALHLRRSRPDAAVAAVRDEGRRGGCTALGEAIPPARAEVVRWACTRAADDRLPCAASFPPALVEAACSSP
jgi:hypothetical protein